MDPNRRSSQGQTLFNAVLMLVSAINLDMAWGKLPLHRPGYHGLLTDRNRVIFWSVLLVVFLGLAVHNALLWRKKRALTDATA